MLKLYFMFVVAVGFSGGLLLLVSHISLLLNGEKLFGDVEKKTKTRMG
ncbi:hypothetical protein [Methylotenera sp.]|nr:hypothetical protein [Methylotenera sp.]MDI1299700.1 hypothetical protein [Methylotenera sp.]